MKKTKAIGYAYPTSETAKSLGYAKDGCWYVTLAKKQHGFSEANLTAAVTLWLASDLPIDRYCMTRHPYSNETIETALAEAIKQQS